FRWRLSWVYGDQIEWRPRMVGLSESPEDYLAKGLTPEKLAGSLAKLSSEHHMPMDTRVPPRMSATIPACRAVVAARLHAPDREAGLLRQLRVRTFSGELIDEPETIAGAAVDAGIDPTELGQWTASAEVAAALAEDMRAARDPSPAALALDEKLAGWSGGRRYTCPSYEIATTAPAEEPISVPGFQPLAVYEVALANAFPGAERRDPPESVAEALRWAGTPLATQEVAVICGLDFNPAREALGRVAVERHVGWDGFWTLAA
ncbi:MAG: DsbA family protein, partial [Actinobacteria bacterium]|nr:DsbA family protein [Actinomycetota bacterium]